MLVLSRKVGEKIVIQTDPTEPPIYLVVHSIEGAAVRIGLEAPEAVRIVRGELLEEAKCPT